MINQVILKLNRSCNLACGYCYYINENTPAPGLRMPLSLCIDFLDEYHEYLKSRGETGAVSLHGGEPLLMGSEYLDRICTHKGFSDDTFKATVQTNGVMLNEKWVEFFIERNVGIGVSFDATAESQNKNRPLVGGRGSYDHVVRAIERLQSKSAKFGILCVIDPNEDGLKVYESLRSLDIESVDLLFPISSHEDSFVTPRHKDLVLLYLKRFFLGWASDRATMRVRLFNIFYRQAEFGDIEFGSIGWKSDGNHYAALEPDGKIHFDEELNSPVMDLEDVAFEPVDFYSMGSFDELERVFKSYCQENKLLQTPDDCANCSVQGVCLSGHPSSRFSRLKHFNNPSTNCKSLKWLGETAIRLKAGQPDYSSM